VHEGLGSAQEGHVLQQLLKLVKVAPKLSLELVPKLNTPPLQATEAGSCILSPTSTLSVNIEYMLRVNSVV
jgi:hypothetical protein